VRKRRSWTTHAENDFSMDFKYEIDLSSELNKKPNKTGITVKLDQMPSLKEKWESLSVDNIKDKIWTLAKRKQKLNR
jgi:hypothetical protein